MQGGGTFIVDVERNPDEEEAGDYDAVVRVTDGYFDPVPPKQDPDKSVILITLGGSGDWVESADLTVCDLDIGPMADA